jgi:CheY-like chemotaxis protein
MGRNISSQRSILVVADDPAIVGTVGLVFRALAYQIRVATSAEEALTQLAEDPPDVILCDNEMRTVDASQLTRDIRTAEGGARVIVILTGYGPEPQANAADGYVSRPFDPIKVVDLIDAFGRAT